MSKKGKFEKKFVDTWLLNDQYKAWLMKKDDKTASCKVCNRDFKVNHMGVGAVLKHKESDIHKNKTIAVKSSQSMSSFVVNISDKDAEEAAISELCLTYHNINHHLSYRSADCSVKLVKNLFHDSKICQSVQCGRTKMQTVTENILFPLSIEMHLKQMVDLPISITTDASNRGNIKLFPIAIQYFDSNSGLNNFVLDFYSDHNENSDAIYQQIVRCINENGLKFENMIAFTADNASVNFGIHQSVYQNLKLLNSSLIKANCNCHVLHNTVKHALSKCPLDIENLVLKLYSHFSISAKRIDGLKSCYEFCDQEFESLRRHVITRWLSLYPAIQRIIDNLKPLKSYFIGNGTENCPIIIEQFVWEKCYNDITIFEMYLNFCSHLMELFYINIQILEKKSTNATNLYDIMFKLRTQLQNRLDKQFFGSFVRENLKNFPADEINSLN